jgi:hypothetical protein
MFIFVFFVIQPHDNDLPVWERDFHATGTSLFSRT